MYWIFKDESLYWLHWLLLVTCTIHNIISNHGWSEKPCWSQKAFDLASAQLLILEFWSATLPWIGLDGPTKRIEKRHWRLSCVRVFIHFCLLWKFGYIKLHSLCLFVCSSFRCHHASWCCLEVSRNAVEFLLVYKKHIYNVPAFMYLSTFKDHNLLIFLISYLENPPPPPFTPPIFCLNSRYPPNCPRFCPL